MINNYNDRYLINSANEMGFQDLKKEYEPKYRNSQRCLFRSKELAKVLFDRCVYVFPFFKFIIERKRKVEMEEMAKKRKRKRKRKHRRKKIRGER